ncbi:cysteine synthase A [Natronobacterium gregoryi]|uniref:Cysteine synthase A n=2 Tax=Natronobacterium gregoryi TaxID=44930 RepID=L0AEH4_NATGS|nr:cysteine synthase A [Natronobacterium gregoryi]AFZ72226.1 cysteine synthase A [Natronobacterium gregoryi SP2]ELY62375.1 cysteine synthase A [Natronobacterium gregoryi SP2]PLK20173.1 cysteine synthase A [Natronobacterium gregoryi SP2]SFJ28479.1 cysteine synthase [Natronobacterium gregoryi]
MTNTDESEPSSTVVEAVDELIGETPLLRLDAFADNLYGKVEAANPYSIKDRIAREMIDAAERSGDLEPGGLVVESTSGNTGIGLAAVSAARGYDCVLTMPESMSEERRSLLRALGAELELTPAEDGMSGANQRAEEIAAERENAVLARQFENEANPTAHRKTTGPEIWRATDGGVDALVAGVGTGGTITGVSEYVKERQGKESFTAVAVEPAESPTLSEQCSDGHDIQGIGPGFVPDVLRTDLIDEVRAVEASSAKEASRKLGRTEGVLVGISSGAALAAAADYANEHPEETTVVVLPDTGERYLSTDLFDLE